jgi:TetR/AcrR family transcriptional regulator, repressor for uid operon
MPKLKPDTQRARREHILDTSERLFASAGFHRTTMHDICREAAISPGALYVYFASKEELIAGITERDRAKLAGQLAEVAKAPDLLAALSRLGEHYAVEEPRYKQQLVIEIGCQSMRDGPVGAIFRSVDEFVLDQFEALFRRAEAEGRIAPTLDPRTLACTIAVLGDGLFWRRAVDPRFDAKTMVPIITSLIATLINPVTSPTPYANTNAAPSAQFPPLQTEASP